MSDATTILLIDDDQQERDYNVQRVATSSPDYDVVEAETGQSGLNLCARQPIDCIVLELDLPDMSGFEVLVKLVPRVYHPEHAVIVLTRLPNPFLLELALRNGASAAFRKPLASGYILHTAILKAISTVRKEKVREVIR